ncbi:MAG: class I SAM-dependent methyltransferase [Acidobacteriota bacterium]
MMPTETTGTNHFNFIEPPAALAGITARTRDLKFDVASEPLTGALLRTLAASKPGGRFLELGTGTGVATAWILAGMDAHSSLTSVDFDAEHQAVARDVLGNDGRLGLVLEDGFLFLKSQPAENYDFVFADAIPGKFEGLEECLRVVKPGGFYIVDDMLPLPKWPKAHVERVSHLMDQLTGDDRLTIAKLAWATGIVVAVKR